MLKNDGFQETAKSSHLQALRQHDYPLVVRQGVMVALQNGLTINIYVRVEMIAQQLKETGKAQVLAVLKIVKLNANINSRIIKKRTVNHL